MQSAPRSGSSAVSREQGQTGLDERQTMTLPQDQESPLAPRRGREVARLRLLLMLPFISASIALFGIWVILLYQHERDLIARDVERERTLLERRYREDIEHDARMLQTAMTVIQHDAALHTALQRRDREALLRLAAPLHAELRRKFDVTHFYFSGPDRVNILRLHQPERHGDRIDRQTTLEAERTGATTYGVELGPLGTFTLRLVTPWYTAGPDQHLIGFVELGMEIDHVLQMAQTSTGMPAFVLLAKQFLQRADWEAGMRMLGRRPEWDLFPDVVLNGQTHENIPPALVGQLTAGLPETTLVMEARQARTESRTVFLPLIDASGRDVGRLGVLIDVSRQLHSSHQTIYGGAAAAALIVGLLIAFFYWLTSRIGRRIEIEERALEHLATHDGLTGLYNHRTFYQLLEEEVARARRYDRPFALLMLDIDHFKQVNDVHGHPAGDAVLRGLSTRLAEQVRIIDRVCRYGGEEIAILLPEMNEEAASATAERLRGAVAAAPFPTGPGADVAITVSIGVAIFPQDGANTEALAAAADHGLYAAKQGGRNRVCHHPD